MVKKIIQSKDLKLLFCKLSVFKHAFLILFVLILDGYYGLEISIFLMEEEIIFNWILIALLDGIS